MIRKQDELEELLVAEITRLSAMVADQADQTQTDTTRTQNQTQTFTQTLPPGTVAPTPMHTRYEGDGFVSRTHTQTQTRTQSPTQSPTRSPTRSRSRPQAVDVAVGGDHDSVYTMPSPGLSVTHASHPPLAGPVSPPRDGVGLGDGLGVSFASDFGDGGGGSDRGGDPSVSYARQQEQEPPFSINKLSRRQMSTSPVSSPQRSSNDDWERQAGRYSAPSAHRAHSSYGTRGRGEAAVADDLVGRGVADDMAGANEVEFVEVQEVEIDEDEGGDDRSVRGGRRCEPDPPATVTMPKPPRSWVERHHDASPTPSSASYGRPSAFESPSSVSEGPSPPTDITNNHRVTHHRPNTADPGYTRPLTPPLPCVIPHAALTQHEACYEVGSPDDPVGHVASADAATEPLAQPLMNAPWLTMSPMGALRERRLL